MSCPTRRRRSSGRWGIIRPTEGTEVAMVEEWRRRRINTLRNWSRRGSWRVDTGWDCVIGASNWSPKRLANTTSMQIIKKDRSTASTSIQSAQTASKTPLGWKRWLSKEWKVTLRYLNLLPNQSTSRDYAPKEKVHQPSISSCIQCSDKWLATSTKPPGHFNRIAISQASPMAAWNTTDKDNSTWIQGNPLHNLWFLIKYNDIIMNNIIDLI